MTPDQLPAVMAFARVAYHGSFTRAATELNVSPSALSQTVRGLEQRLGAQLLNRTTRNVSITEIGRQFLERVAPALETLDAAFAEVNELRARPTGTLRINLPRVAMRIALAPVLEEFLRTYPEVKLDLFFNDGLIDLVAGGFDAGIRLDERLAANMHAVKITGEQRMVVAGSPEYFRNRAKPQHPADLSHHSCVCYRYATGAVYRWEFTTATTERQDFDVEVDGPLIVNDVEAMVEAAREGIGLIMMLEDYVRPDIVSGRLITVLEEWCQPFPGYCLYYPNRKFLPMKLRALIDFLRARFNDRAKTLVVDGSASKQTSASV